MVGSHWMREMLNFAVDTSWLECLKREVDMGLQQEVRIHTGGVEAIFLVWNEPLWSFF